jgi:hypothetical protein
MLITRASWTGRQVAVPNSHLQALVNRQLGAGVNSGLASTATHKHPHQREKMNMTASLPFAGRGPGCRMPGATTLAATGARRRCRLLRRRLRQVTTSGRDRTDEQRPTVEQSLQRPPSIPCVTASRMANERNVKTGCWPERYQHADSSPLTRFKHAQNH